MGAAGDKIAMNAARAKIGNNQGIEYRYSGNNQAKIIDFYEIEVNVSKYQLRIYKEDLGKTAMKKGWGGVSELKKKLVTLTSPENYQHSNIITLNYRTLEEKVFLFSEEGIKNPVESLNSYFDIREDIVDVKRRVPTDYPDLCYLPSDLDYRFEFVLSSIGEGVAGYLMESLYDYKLIARPLGLHPDFIMRKDNDTDILVEVVCGSTFKEIRRGVMAGMFYLMDLLSHFCYLSDKKFEAYVVGVELAKRNEFESFIVEGYM